MRNNIENPQNEVQVKKAGDLQVVEDKFCGKLTILPNGSVLANGFAHNTGHFHTKFDETYLVLKGSLTLALHSPEANRTVELQLGELDSVKIPRGVGHKVIGGSSDNSIQVWCEPNFVPGDETLSTVLESRYPSSQSLNAPQLTTDRQALKTLIEMKTIIDGFTKYLKELDDFKAGSSDYAQDWNNIYSTGEFVDQGEELSEKIPKLQVQALESTINLESFTSECNDFFKSFYKELTAGNLVLDPQTIDGLIDVGSLDGKRKHKFELTMKLKKDIDHEWSKKISPVFGAIEI